MLQSFNHYVALKFCIRENYFEYSALICQRNHLGKAVIHKLIAVKRLSDFFKGYWLTKVNEIVEIPISKSYDGSPSIFTVNGIKNISLPFMIKEVKLKMDWKVHKKKQVSPTHTNFIFLVVFYTWLLNKIEFCIEICDYLVSLLQNWFETNHEENFNYIKFGIVRWSFEMIHCMLTNVTLKKILGLFDIRSFVSQSWLNGLLNCWSIHMVNWSGFWHCLISIITVYNLDVKIGQIKLKKNTSSIFWRIFYHFRLVS